MGEIFPTGSSEFRMQKTGIGTLVLPGIIIVVLFYLLLGGAAFALLWSNKIVMYIIIGVLALWIFRRLL